jgi:N-acyl-D-aspartate/D-glutamate deacylase
MRDPEFRAAFREELAARPLLFHGKWQHTEVQPTMPEHEAWRGKSIAQIAAERGADPLDTFFDLGLEEDLKTRFILALLNIDEDLVLELISHPSVLIAASDAGAHLTLLCDAGYPARLLGYWVRDKGALKLEAAVKSLTSTPASIYGINGRGLLRPGYYADVVVYDPATIIDNPKRLVYDLPGGEPRLTRDATGINYVFVNGQPLVSEGKISEAARERPSGQILRSGR